MKKERYTGSVDGTNNTVMFSSDRYNFTFFPTQPFHHGQRYAIPITDEFILGTSSAGYKVAIYYGGSREEIPMDFPFTFKSQAYLATETDFHELDIAHFQRIVFVGGVLNALREESSVETRLSDNGDRIVESLSNRLQYSFACGESNCSVTIGLLETGSFGLHNYSINNKVCLALSFDKPQPLSLLHKHYVTVCQLISVMTNRSENPFEAIYISPPASEPLFHLKKAYVHLQENDSYKTTEFPCISFDDLGGSLPSILEIMFNSKENEPSYSLGFIPRNDSEAFNITDDTVRALLSSLECEAYFDSSIGLFQSGELEYLCGMVKSVVRHHRKKNKGKPLLSDGTYSVIHGSIKNWSMSAFEKIDFLFHKHEKAIRNYCERYSPMITEEDIRSLVKYRNSITHGTYRELTRKLRHTAVVMEVLVYCCFLCRAGMPEETIEELCASKIGN